MAYDNTFHCSAKGVVIRNDRILLVQYYEEGVGVHYNLPGGRQRKDETLPQALTRKMKEEAGAEVEVGPFMFLYEFISKNHGGFDGDKHSVSAVFRCSLRAGCEPSMALCTKPDRERQTDVCWLPLDEFPKVTFWPSVPELIIKLHAQSAAREDLYLGDIL